MKLMSRLLTVLMLSTGVLGCVPGDALAQSYPSKPINIITPFPPGGAGDIVSRILGQKLMENLGQPVVVFNRGGGNTVIGTGIAAKAPADGYNLFLGQSSNMTIVPALYKHGSSKVLPYDTMKDLTPVAFVGVGPLILGLHPSVPVKSVKELIALAKSKPGKLNYNSSVSGGTTHLSMELFKNMAGVDIVHIPYTGGGPQVIAIMSGQVDLGFASITNTLPQVKAGIKLNTEINKFLVDTKVKERMTALGIDVISKTPEQFETFLVEEMAMWEKVVKHSGAKVN